ncbi:hypothetical protein DS901_06675 [Loktanella sp. D2R18]|uniref:hypothetical protein n=1 Tax=Rhodobacterales TaxID=204455 RepID=UPI000DE8D5EE|nr:MULTISPECIES: hypothetical protein [Rhodobacterales]MDO6589454.1 hypothetical protein [Yoonia sp. 1_MG-2023]RBW44105.1 hypothetical protein DS901_06675 [Loktanella sp. D2R18]
MNIIKPVDYALTSVSEAEDDAAVWDAATTYNFGNPVMQDGLVYVSAIDGNTGLDPSLEEQELTGVRWVLRGATNIRKFMDASLSTQTVGEGPLIIEVTASERFTALALFGLETSETTVEIITGVTTTTAATIVTGAEPANNWWDWLNTVFYASTDRLVLTGLSGFAGSTIRLTINGGSPALGSLVVGRVISIGTSIMDGATKLRRRTFTKIDTNDFGDVTVTRRAIARDVTYAIVADRAGFGAKAQFLDSVDGVRVVTFATDGWEQFINYGFITDWELPANMPNHFMFEITTQGVS